MTIKEIIDDERIDLAMQLDMLSETELNIIDFAFERIEDAVMKRIVELEKELTEEARLNGMGAEREAKQLARITELETRFEICKDASTAKDYVIEAYEKQIDLLQSLMCTAANEIETHWDAHCDAKGNGPIDLVNRLRKTINFS